MNYKYDVAIIGSGPGGYVAAIRASQLGLKTVIIEKSEIGGICLNWGCIPSKAIINQARIFASIPSLENMGIKIDKSNFSYENVYKKSRLAADRLSKGVAYLLKKNNVELINGEAKILNQNTLKINNDVELTSRNIIIATGSSSRRIPGFEFDEEYILSSTGILNLKKLPESMIILGAGAIGLEFAYILNSFGCEVTIVEMLDELFPTGDAEVTKEIQRIFRKKKINVHLGTRAIGYKKTGGRLELAIERSGESSVIIGDKILVAIGRKPNTEDLGLENVGIKPETGYIKTGDYYKTEIENIFAIGDVIDTPQLAHVASKEGEIAAEYIAGYKTEARIKIDEIPYGVYCEPQIAGFGLTEKGAEAKELNFKKAAFPYRGAGKSVAIEETDGLVKVIFDRDTREILGAHIIGAEATELVHELLLAKTGELLLEDVARMIHAHPTLSEALMEAARLSEGRAIHI